MVSELPVPEVGMITIEPPLVDMVAEEPEGAVMVSGLAVLELLKIEIEPPEAMTEEPAPRFSAGATNLRALPPVTDRVAPSARVMAPVGSLLATLSFRTCTSPPSPALNV